MNRKHKKNANNKYQGNVPRYMYQGISTKVYVSSTKYKQREVNESKTLKERKY